MILMCPPSSGFRSLSFHSHSSWYQEQSRGIRCHLWMHHSSLLTVGQMGSWNLMCTGCLQCGPQELGGRRVDWYSACFWTLHHFQFSPALNPRWHPAHGCGPAELRLWGSWALAGDVMEHSFAVVGWDLAGVQVAQPSCPHSMHLEMKPLPYSEQLLHRGHMFL